tara:strand:- start:454 stop:687 length:234 start_codon:yes stop_codon:yes gene_type:complete
MFDTIKIPKPVQDLIKVFVGIKVVLLIVISIVESTSNIKELKDKDYCIEQMTSIYEGTKNKEISRSKAVNYCNGGKQ